MTETEFWSLIAKVDVTALDHGNEDAAVKPLQRDLSAMPEQQLVDFGEILSQKLYALDGKKYAQNAGESGDSDDGFLYARCYVVAKGQKFYESVLVDPKKNGEIDRSMVRGSLERALECLGGPHGKGCLRVADRSLGELRKWK